MADNVSITPGSGNTVGADEVTDATLGTVKVQYVKLMDGTIDSTNKLIVNSDGSLNVKLESASIEIGKVDQGLAGTLAGAWPVELSDGTNLLGVSAHPVRTDPTGTTTQPVSGMVSISGTVPVSGTFFQTTQPVSLAVAPTTTVIQPTGTNLHVVVDAAPSTAITGTVSVSNFPATQQVSGTVTANAGTNLNTSALALETGGNLASLNTKTPALGQALAAASVPVVLTAAQLTTLTPLSSVAVSNFPGTQSVSGTVTANAGTGNFIVAQATAANLNATITGSVSVSNFPATQPISGTVAATQSGAWTSTVTQATGTNLHVVVDTAPTTAVTGTFFQATQPVSGTFFQTTQPVSAASLPLPTGAATSANQSTEISSLATIATNTTNAGTPTVSGTVTANQGGTWTVQPGNTPNTASWLVEERPPTIQTYAASIVGLVPLAAGATDLFTISGSATKTVKVLSLHISGNATTAVTVPLSIIKRSAANTGGTSTAPTVTPHDSNNAAGTAVVLAYTANPTALGATVGMLDTFKLDLPASATATNVNLDEDFNDGQPYVLRGTAQILAINLNTSAITAGNLTVAIHWTEE